MIHPGKPRGIWLCADDYGMAPGVNAAIRQLIARGRLNATSVMVAAPFLNTEEAAALDALNSGKPRAAIGLHVTLSAPFRPMSEGFAPLRGGHFPTNNEMGRLAMTRRLKVERLVIEVGTQLRSFVDAFGRFPDFIDGHQHVHLFPQIRDAVLKVVAEASPQSWVRQCGAGRAHRSKRGGKALTLDVLNLGFRRKAKLLGIRTNPAFAGAYDFTAMPDFAKLFPRFLAGMPEGGLIMCHPGFVDRELESLDPFTKQREREFAYLDSEEFPRVLTAHGLALARPGEAAAAA